MRYRSDVAMALYPASKEGSIDVIKVWFDSYKPDLYKYGWLHCFEWVGSGDGEWLLFRADGALQSALAMLINKMFNEFKNSFPPEDYNYEWVRLGENTEDLEEEYGDHGMNKLYISRYINSFYK